MFSKKYWVRFVVVVMFASSAAFIYGISVAIWHVFPYGQLSAVYKKIKVIVNSFDQSNVLDTGVVDYSSVSHESNETNSNKNNVLGGLVKIPSSVQISEESLLNNFKLRWGRVPSNEMVQVGAVKYLPSEVWFVNQRDPDILGKLGLSNTIGAAGGIRALFDLDGIEYAYIAYQDKSCPSARIYNLETYDVAFQMPCIPEVRSLDLAGVGGGWTRIDKDTVLLAAGTPTMAGVESSINQLAQIESSLWGKVLLIKQKESNLDVSVFSSGHRNPQGISVVDEIIYSVEHGPRGGDELNILVAGNNYGWPAQSFGSEYNLSYIDKDLSLFADSETPLLSFVPSIGISDVGPCPDSYASYYKPNSCVAVSSMIGNSIYLVVHNTKKVFFTEKLYFGSRIRKFEFEGERLIAVTDFEGLIVGAIEEIAP